jgi:hypothetical protein
MLWAAGLLFALWTIALAALAFATANPPVVNWRQLSQARHLAVVQVEDVASGRCRLLRTLTPGALPGTLQVLNLDEAKARAGREYILPLAPAVASRDGTYRIVALEERGIGPLIYPATPEFESQIAAWQRGAL